MDALTFKKTLTSVLEDIGFRRKGNSYYKDDQEVYCVIGLQKSNYANSYYINTGFFIKELQPDITSAKSTDGHIGKRFTEYGFGEPTREFNLDLIREAETEKLKGCFLQNITDFVDGSLSIQGLKNLLVKYPGLNNRIQTIAEKYLA